MNGPTVNLHHAADHDRVEILGFMDEDLGKKLTALFSGAKSATVVFDLAQVDAINSSGIRDWTYFIRTFATGRTLSLENCPPCFVEQMNVIHAMIGHCQVRSLFLPMACQG